MRIHKGKGNPLLVNINPSRKWKSLIQVDAFISEYESKMEKEKEKEILIQVDSFVNMNPSNNNSENIHQFIAAYPDATL